MAKVTSNRLNNEIIDSLIPKEKEYKMFDGRGLYLLVYTNGSKAWKFKYRYNGTERKLSFGMYPYVGIQQARSKRDDAHRLLNEGFDPCATYAHHKMEKISSLAKIRMQQKQLTRLAKNRENYLKIKRDLVVKLVEMSLDEYDIIHKSKLLDELICSIEDYWKERQQTLVAEPKTPKG